MRRRGLGVLPRHEAAEVLLELQDAQALPGAPLLTQENILEAYLGSGAMGAAFRLPYYGADAAWRIAAGPDIADGACLIGQRLLGLDAPLAGVVEVYDVLLVDTESRFDVDYHASDTMTVCLLIAEYAESGHGDEQEALRWAVRAFRPGHGVAYEDPYTFRGSSPLEVFDAGMTARPVRGRLAERAQAFVYDLWWGYENLLAEVAQDDILILDANPANAGIVEREGQRMAVWRDLGLLWPDGGPFGTPEFP